MDRLRSDQPPRPWTRRAKRALLLGLCLTLALGAAGLLISFLGRRPLLRTLMWVEFAGGTLVCAVAALLLLWRPREVGRVAEREETANAGFGLLAAGLVAVATGLLVSWVWQL
ncbi:MAG: hypothetical protein ACM3XZ_03620 [Betaproteobacteria bacterium]